MTQPEPWVLGIDLGTTYTVVASRTLGREPQVLEVGGERRVPSVVFIDDDGTIVVGRSADNLAGAQPARAIRAPKSRLGEPAPVILGGRTYASSDLVAAILVHVYAEAVLQMGAAPVEVRLTHPAAWSKPRRAQLADAAAVAGLPNPLFVPEPVAAALAYADDTDIPEGGHVAVYDLGGGTFDSAILRSGRQGFEIVGRPSGEDRLGGELFDELLANHIGAHLDADVWEKLQVSEELEWQRGAAALRAEARRVKESLSTHPYAELLLGLPTGMVHQRVNREELEELIEPYIAETVDLSAQALEDAGVSVDDLSAIFLAGGASRSPLIEQMLTEAFPGIAVSRRGDPKTAVAVGATHARALGAQASKFAELSSPSTSPSLLPPPPPSSSVAKPAPPAPVNPPPPPAASPPPTPRPAPPQTFAPPGGPPTAGLPQSFPPRSGPPQSFPPQSFPQHGLPQATYLSSPPAKPGGKGKIIAIVGAVVVGLIVLAVVLSSLGSGNGSAGSTTTSTSRTTAPRRTTTTAESTTSSLIQTDATTIGGIAEELIIGELADQISAGPLTPSCDPVADDAEIGTIFLCTGTTEDLRTVNFEARKSAEDAVEVNSTNFVAPADLPQIEATAVEALETSVGTTLGVENFDCGTEGLILAEGDAIVCALTDPFTGDVFDAFVTIEDLRDLSTVFVQVADAPRPS